MKRWFRLFILYLLLILALVFLSTPPDPEVAMVKITFEYQQY